MVKEEKVLMVSALTSPHSPQPPEPALCRLGREIGVVRGAGVIFLAACGLWQAVHGFEVEVKPQFTGGVEIKVNILLKSWEVPVIVGYEAVSNEKDSSTLSTPS